jgi:hypothetical protein
MNAKAEKRFLRVESGNVINEMEEPLGAVDDKHEPVALSLFARTDDRHSQFKKNPPGKPGEKSIRPNLLALVLLSALAAVLAALVTLARILLLLAGLVLAAALLLSAVTALLILLAGLLLATLAGLIVLAHGLLLLRANPAIRQRSSGGICFLFGVETGHLSNISSCRIGPLFKPLRSARPTEKAQGEKRSFDKVALSCTVPTRRDARCCNAHGRVHTAGPKRPAFICTGAAPHDDRVCLR